MFMVCGISNGMTLTIDPAGRIVLPKPIRDRLGLGAGTKLELTELSEGLLLRRLEQRPSLVREGPFLIHQGSAPPGFDSVTAVEEQREERIHSLFGQR
jgi:AbrB family looped-hinge helix DNA binding protein